jgi:hypothetical protein
MLNRGVAHSVVFCLAYLVLQLANPLTICAQAWVPEKGSGSVTTIYQKVDVRYHYNAAGLKQDTGHIHSHNSTTALEYGVTDKLAMEFDVTYMASKYQGTRPHGPPDTGFFHPTFQDIHFNLRYKVLERPLVITPFVGFSIPTHDYAVQGHSAVGKGFKEFVVGVNAGRRLDSVLPNTYFEVRYSFAMHKRFAGLNLNRSNVDWEIGWWANKSITFRFIGNAQRTHGGFDFPEDIHGPEDFDIHDRVAKSNFVQLGGGVTYSVNRLFDVHVAYAPTPIYARNAHGDRGIIIGFSWNFSRDLASRRIASNTSPRRRQSPQQENFSNDEVADQLVAHQH